MSVLRSASSALARLVARRAKDQGQLGDNGSFANRAASRSAVETSAGEAGEAGSVAAKAVSGSAGSAGSASAATRVRKSTSLWKDYKQLSKLRLSMLVTVRHWQRLARGEREETGTACLTLLNRRL